MYDNENFDKNKYSNNHTNCDKNNSNIKDDNNNNNNRNNNNN